MFVNFTVEEEKDSFEVNVHDEVDIATWGWKKARPVDIMTPCIVGKFAPIMGLVNNKNNECGHQLTLYSCFDVCSAEIEQVGKFGDITGSSISYFIC